MMKGIKSTLLAGLLAGVALSALPAAAQDAPLPPTQDGPPAANGFPRFDLAQYDTNGDGKVTIEEIQAKRKAEAAALDANGDGKLSYDELVAAELREVQPRIEARVKARIAALDTDGDGQLSAAELATGPMGARMFERLDANDDGVVSEDEVKAAQDKMRERMQDDRRGPRADQRGDRRDDSRSHGDRPGDRRPQLPAEGAPQN